MDSKLVSVQVVSDEIVYAYLANYADGRSRSGSLNVAKKCSANRLFSAVYDLVDNLGGEDGQIITLGCGDGCKWVCTAS